MGDEYPRPDVSVAYQAPRDEVEQMIAEIWQDAFGIEAIGIFDDFFELGGDSLLALNLAAHLQATFTLQISARQCLEMLTIENIGNFIKANVAQGIELVELEKIPRALLDEIEQS